MHPFVGACEVEIGLRGPARLLNETVQYDQPLPPIDVKQHSSDAVAVELGTNFMQSAAHRAAHRHAHRPAELDRLQAFADAPAIGESG